MENSYIPFWGLLDWGNLIAGFLLGLIPTIIPIAVGHVRAYFSPMRKKYYGDYFIYYRGGTNPDLIRARKINIYRSPFGNDRIKSDKDTNTGLSYKGNFYRQNGFIYFYASSTYSKDGILQIFYDRVEGEMTRTTGAMVSLNLNGQPTCWKAVLSKIELSEHELSELLPEKPIVVSPVTRYRPAA